MKKTNAVRLIERLGIAHEIAEYDIDMEAFSAEAVAALIGMQPGAVFKTLVASGASKDPCFAVVAADAELDLKALARAHGEKKIDLVAVKEVEPLTGYRRGGVTAVGAKKPFAVYLDSAAFAHGRIGVSAGVKGLQILLAPSDYVVATDATVADISRRDAALQS